MPVLEYFLPDYLIGQWVMFYLNEVLVKNKCITFYP